MTANLINYRGQSTMREIGKALEFSEDTLKRFSKLFANGDFPHTLGLEAQLEKAGIGKENPQALAAARVYREMKGLPRHLGQHSGGMIICEGRSVPSFRWKTPPCRAAWWRSGTRTIAPTWASSRSICSVSA